MTRFTVTYSRAALDDLSQLWLEDSQKSQISQAANSIDKLLATDPPQKAIPVDEGLYRLEVDPLLVYFSISEDDRKVTIWYVKKINGK